MLSCRRNHVPKVQAPPAARAECPCARPTLALAKTKDVISPLPLSNVLISLRSNDRVAYGEAELLSRLSLNHTIPVGCRSAADVEQSLTQLLLNAQNNHEEIILEVTDFRPGTESGYNTPCPLELQMP